MPSSCAPSTRQPAHVRARGEQRAARSAPRPCRQPRHPRRRVELHHARARQQLDVCSAHQPSGAGTRPRARLAAQVLLRARRPLVGRVELAAHEQDRAVEARARAAPRRTRPTPRRRRQQDVDVPVSHGRPADANCGGDRLLEPGVEHEQHLVAAPRSPCRPSGTKPPPSRSTEMISAPSGSSTSATARPAAGAPVGDLELDDLQPLLLAGRAGARARSAAPRARSGAGSGRSR